MKDEDGYYYYDEMVRKRRDGEEVDYDDFNED